jgi:hypothetical protein
VLAVGLFSNRLVLIGIALEVTVLVILVLVPPLARVFGLAPLAVEEWSVLLLFPPAMLLLDEGRKLLVRRLTSAPAA